MEYVEKLPIPFDDNTRWVELQEELYNYVSGLELSIKLKRTNADFFDRIWLLNGDGLFKVPEYTGRWEDEEVTQNAESTARCPSHAVYTYIFEPYEAVIVLQANGYADGKLYTDGEVHNFTINMETGEITE